MAIAHVLLTDDNEDQSLIARESLLEDESLTVDEVHSGEVCLQQLSTRLYDLVILDYSMPRMNGVEVLRAMRARGDLTPVLMVTGYGDENVAVEAMKLGAADYVIKSPNYHHLLPTIVHRTLEIQRHRTELESERIINVRLRAILETAVTVNHEINNPLVMIIGYAELLMTLENTLSDDATVYLQGILTASRRIELVTRRLAQVITPATKTYLGDLQMLDLDAATAKS